MELEAKRKALRSGQREIKGPVIRYLSTSMPAIKVFVCPRVRYVFIFSAPIQDRLIKLLVNIPIIIEHN